MFCSQCGSELKETDAKCPYCGALNPLGAEKAFMDQLEDIKEDTEDLGNMPVEEYQKTLKRQGKFAIKVAFLVVGIFLVVFLAFRVMVFYEESKNKEVIQNQMEFEQKYFPKLYDLYSQGDDEAVLSYLNELYEKDGSEALFQWKPIVYYIYYEEYQEVEWLWERFQEGELSQEDLSIALPYILKLAFGEVSESDASNMKKEHLEKIEGFCEKTRSVMKEVLPVSEEEARKIYQDCYGEGYPDYEKCEEYASQIYLKIKEELE